MIPYERQKKIIRLIAGKDLVKIDELQVQLPNISISTLRRDLKALETNGNIEYLVGGAIKATATTSELPMSEKATLHEEQKK